MVEATPADPDVQLEELCRVLNHFGGALRGLRQPRGSSQWRRCGDHRRGCGSRTNLERLAEALNLVGARWRIEGRPQGMRIDGGLGARHFLGDSVAVGLVTRLGPVDVVLEPKGYEGGYDALIPDATTVRRGDVEIRVGALADLVHSKELLGGTRTSSTWLCCTTSGLSWLSMAK